ncbi:Holliday junction resolvase RuvX [Candidatus Fukatsuia anoeciicola]|uniref:Holliday junction resolvase RuvX n=1 Tax=Candidatus Fukatsuia anoeciicola TaxID=2994492 RepID=UPI003463B705
MVNRTIIGFDFGTKNIGVAIGQEIIGTATGLTTFKAQEGIPNWQQIKKLLQEWQPDLVVVGLPLNMDGTEQPLTRKARRFTNCLHERFSIKVILHDERLSTIEARSYLFTNNGYRALNKKRINAVSAACILESWFKQQIS